MSPPDAPRDNLYTREADYAAGYINFLPINGAVIAPEFGDAGGIDMARAPARVDGSQPDEGRLAGGAQREQRGEGGGAGRIERVGGRENCPVFGHGAPGLQPRLIV